jgi:tRNA(Arg) A34 adenosine deaminase TadA
VHSRVRRVFYAIENPECGALRSRWSLHTQVSQIVQLFRIMSMLVQSCDVLAVVSALDWLSRVLLINFLLLKFQPTINHHYEVYRGLCAKECTLMLRTPGADQV